MPDENLADPDGQVEHDLDGFRDGYQGAPPPAPYANTNRRHRRQKGNTMTTKKPAKKLSKSPIKVGAGVLIRSVTLYYTGRIVEVTDAEIVILDAAWIADTGRFAAALASGQFAEVEPYPDGAAVSIARGSILDVSAWAHALPREVR